MWVRPLYEPDLNIMMLSKASSRSTVNREEVPPPAPPTPLRPPPPLKTLDRPSPSIFASPSIHLPGHELAAGLCVYPADLRHTFPLNIPISFRVMFPPSYTSSPARTVRGSAVLAASPRRS